MISRETSLKKSKKRQAITPLLQKVIDGTMNLPYFLEKRDKHMIPLRTSLKKSKKRQAIKPLLQKVIDSTMNLAYFSKTTLDDSSGGIGGLRRSGSALGGSGGALGGSGVHFGRPWAHLGHTWGLYI